MSKKQAPEWIQKSRAYRLLIEAAEVAYNEDCACRCCQLIREWAETAPPPPKPSTPEGAPVGKRRRT